MTISLDHHSTTPTAPEVIAAMEPYWREIPWNAHSPHAGGARAEAAVCRARAAVAALVGAEPAEIVFTSGATEANNLALLGLGAAARRELPGRVRILTSAIEHKCVLEAARHLARQGFMHELIPVTAGGVVDLDRLEAMLGPDVLLVAVMAASNELGTIQPLEEVAALAHAAGALCHVDAAQAAGRVPLDLVEAECDTASLSAHKMYGPMGVGALYVSAASPLRPAPLFFGGGQEQGLRPGTLPVPLLVGFGRAAELAMRERRRGDALRELASLFLAELRRRGVAAVVNGDSARRLPGSLNFLVPGVDAEAVVARLGDRLHLSTGSACQSGELQGSHVLRALGLTPTQVSASFRLCFGREHGEEHAREAAKLLAEEVSPCDSAAGRFVQRRGHGHGNVRIG